MCLKNVSLFFLFNFIIYFFPEFFELPSSAYGKLLYLKRVLHTLSIRDSMQRCQMIVNRQQFIVTVVFEFIVNLVNISILELKPVFSKIVKICRVELILTNVHEMCFLVKKVIYCVKLCIKNDIFRLKN